MFSGARISVDTPSDFEFLEKLYSKTEAIPGEIKIKEVVSILNSESELLKINSHVHQKNADEKTKNILFRCDGDHKTGLGHVYRCIALADELRDKYGFGISFAMQSGEIGFNIVSEAGFKVIENEEMPENDWFDTTISKIKPDCIILDIRTDLCAAILKKWKKRGILIVSIDDPSERRMESDLAFYPPVPQVNKMNWDGYKGKAYSGWEWVLLRKECLEQYDKPINTIPNLLVTMGGSDPFGLTLNVIKALNRLKDNFELSIILGLGFKNHTILENALSKSNTKFQVYKSPKNIYSIFSKADIAIASFGVTAYELAVLGIPSLYLCLTNDHFESASALVNMGIGKSIPPSNINDITFLTNEFKLFIRDTNKHKSKKTNTPIDGLGVSRISSLINQRLNN